MAQVRYGSEPLAHSSPGGGKPGESYARHIEAVRHGAIGRAKEMLRYARDPRPDLLNAIEAAAVFHDLGKLDPETQKAFTRGRGISLKWDHIDAGVAHLSANQDWMSAWLVRAHHRPGLPQKTEHFTGDKTDRRLRGRRNDCEGPDRHNEQITRTNTLLEECLNTHNRVVGPYEVHRKRPVHGLAMRLALSCLVDADHTDSAAFDSGYTPPASSEPRWSERLDVLKQYILSLPGGETEAERLRNRQRSAFFEACLSSDIQDSIIACEAPVGLGKTTSVTAYLIRRAIADGLRRLIIVAPFTNILTQTARRLKKALILPSELTDQVIVEHHHRAEFSHREDRDLSVVWQAPIVLTTAVSFFETLAACDPASLRKLHAVPGSAIFIDEAHAALPVKLWPQSWRWMRQLADEWGCRIVLASGSLVRFWEDDQIINPPVKLKELLPPDELHAVARDELKRIKYHQAAEGQVIDPLKLVDIVTQETGPRLVILNTVQNAAVIARAMRESGMDVLHLSTALTPRDRYVILKRVQHRLQSKENSEWTLVATSCVESGVELSFRCAFRERFSTSSIIQVGGRVNRHGEYNECGGATVYDFALDGDGITQHPAAAISSPVLQDLLNEGKLNNSPPAEVVTAAMREELKISGGLPSDLLTKAESHHDYPRVKELCRVIEADTRFVVIEPKLIELLKQCKHINFRTLLQGSVQLWASKVDKLALEALPGHKEIYVWTDDYDPDFLGYMSGVFKNEAFQKGDVWII